MPAVCIPGRIDGAAGRNGVDVDGATAIADVLLLATTEAGGKIGAAFVTAAVTPNGAAIPAGGNGKAVAAFGINGVLNDRMGISVETT